METQVWTDGSYSRGVGGWAWVSRTGWNAGKCVYRATAEAMEIRAILEALRNNEGDLVIYTDNLNCALLFSQERHMLHGWLAGRRRKRDTLEHALRVLVFEEMAARKIRVVHIKGHNGDTYNERAHKLANNARLSV
jgi:ribonuclease HI